MMFIQSRRISSPVRFALVLLVAVSGLARASLQWTKETVELRSKIGQSVVRTAFHFTNSGKEPISITRIQPSCGCVATELEKFEYAPGEGGEIKVTFDLEMDDVAGLQEQTISVTTTETPKSPTVLHLRVNVPETVSVSPEILLWNRDEKPEAKIALVTAGPEIAPMKLTQASFNGDFSVEITPKIKGRSYLVKITPKTTASPSYAQIEVQAKSTSFPRPEVCKVNANVR